MPTPTRTGIIVDHLPDEWPPTCCEHCGPNGIAAYRVVYPTGIGDRVVDVCEECLYNDFNTEA